MTIDTATLTDLNNVDRLNAIVDHLKSIPLSQRAGVIEAFQRGLEETREGQAKIRLAPPRPRLPAPARRRLGHLAHSRRTRLRQDTHRCRVGPRSGRGQGNAHRIALVARTIPEAQSIMIEGESGIINVSPPWNKPTYEPSKRKLTWPTGAHALVFSSHEPDQLRGPQFDAAWCDELASWEYPEQTWDNLSFALRLGRRPRSVVTTTPKPIELVRTLIGSPGTFITRGTTFDNKDNLAPAFFNGIIDRYDGTRIGQQEIHAEITDEDEDALWKREWIEKARLGSYPPIARIVVSIDPAMSTRPTSSETGIVVVGADMRRQHAYILADESGRLTPNNMALRVAHLYDKFNATQIVVEANAGGNHVETTLRNAIERTLPIKSIRARHGKQIRAEPVAALYEQGRVHHVGRFPELEDQMCTWTPDLGPSHSPDRADALVHAVTDLILNRNPINFW